MARFAFSPRTAQVGDSVEFVSSSFDRDGEVRSQAWDLDGDGAFDDARGDDVFYTFTSSGVKRVRLQVTDFGGRKCHLPTDDYDRAGAEAAWPGYLRPDPDIHFIGVLFSARAPAWAETSRVRAPRGALVTVRCKGKTCGVKQRRKRVERGAVRFKTYERFLRAGVKLESSAASRRRSASTALHVRACNSPASTDRCLEPNKNKPLRHCS